MTQAKPHILTLAELRGYRNQGYSQRQERYYCCVHNSDHQRSLQLNHQTGRFQCHSCGAWGYVEELQAPEYRRGNRGAGPTRIAPKPPPPKPEPKSRPELAELLKEFQLALPGSCGEAYLKSRRIPLTLAQGFGCGYAAYGKWPGRQWRPGRLVFPHTNPAGDIINLYGRAVGNAPKGSKHDHLKGPKGNFNAPVLNGDEAYLCEGPFDALALIAAGYRNSCAIFGLNGLRWKWIKAKWLILCFDNDTCGQQHQREVAWEATLRGYEVYTLEEDAYQVHGDLAEAWAATGRLNL